MFVDLKFESVRGSLINSRVSLWQLASDESFRKEDLRLGKAEITDALDLSLPLSGLGIS